MPNDTTAACDPAEPISCRPSNDWWSLIGMALFFSLMSGLVLLLPSTPPPANPALQNIFFGGVSAACFLGALLMLGWRFHARMIADAEGLRWRGFFEWKSVGWADVQDYYDRIPPPSQGRSHLRVVIKTSAGSLSFGSQWTHGEAFREQVAQRATNAVVEQWGVLGSRPCDAWPQAFDYNTLENRWAPRLWFKLFLTFVVYLLIRPAMQLSAMAGLIGWAMTLMTAGLYLLLVGSGGLIFLIPLAQYRAAGRRKRERITVTLDEIIFEDDRRRIAVAWAEVTRYAVAPGPGSLTLRYVVETQQGNFDFLTGIRQAMLLKAMIQRHAVEAADTEWRSRVNPEALGGETARWSGGQIGVGARVYHYQTREYRALLWLPAALGLTMLFLAILSDQGLPLGGSLTYFLSFAGTMGLVFLGGWYAYRTCRIETDVDGLTRITPLGRRRLLWNQVERYELSREGRHGVEGRGERLRFGKEIIGYEELQAEITRRVMHMSNEKPIRD